MYFEHPDDAGFTYTSEAEWDRAEAREQGAERPDLAWVCTSRDVWHRNPFYTGPAVPHPEDFDEPSDEDMLGLAPWRPSTPDYGTDDIPF